MMPFFAVLMILIMSGCGGRVAGEPVFSASAGDVKPGEPLGTTFTVSGNLTYDKVWDAAMAAMSTNMTVIEQHKPTGVIKSKGGEKIVGLFITPTAPKAIEYRIETSSVRPLGLNSTNGRGWEPVVVRDFKAALYSTAISAASHPPQRNECVDHQADSSQRSWTDLCHRGWELDSTTSACLTDEPRSRSADHSDWQDYAHGGDSHRQVSVLYLVVQHPLCGTLKPGYGRPIKP